MRHAEILDRLRAEGLTVVETNGWRTRGSDTFTPVCSVNHHTAGALSGDAPSLDLVIKGRPPRPGVPGVPGPLCNVLQSRQRDQHGLDVVYVIAAGRANHAGVGHWTNLTGNSKAWGLEVEHIGTAAEPFPHDRIDTSVRVHAAFAHCSGFTADQVCQHWEWATPPGRKTDFTRAHVDAVQFRALIAQRLTGTPAPTPLPTPPVVTVPGSMEAAVRITVPVTVADHRGYADLRKGYANLPATIAADHVLALVYAGDDPGDGWGPKPTAPLELVDTGGVARIVVPGHEVDHGIISVYVTVAD